MKLLSLTYLAVAAIGTLIAIGGTALASSCGFRGYGYSSSYNYGSSYGHSTYYGYSYHQPGTYYWPGGYYSGYGWPSGYYGAGYYGSAPSYTPSCSYHAPAYPVVPYIPKFEAAFLVARFPTYGVYAETSATGGGTDYSGSGMTIKPPTYAATADSGKLDRILVLAEQTSGRLTKVESRLDVLEGKRNSPHPDVPGKPPVTPPPANTEKPDGPSILHGRCAICHEQKNVARERSKITLFVTGENGSEVAKLNAKGEIEPLSLADLKKVEKVLADSSMPPERDAGGKAVAKMTAAERRDSLEFIRRVLSGNK